MAQQITYLLTAHTRLPLAQIPTRGDGERVRTSRSAPLPLRLDPLSLTGGGWADAFADQDTAAEDLRGLIHAAFKTVADGA